MKQTAVEWLIKEFNLESYSATIEIAKQMEKEQIIIAYKMGDENGCAMLHWTFEECEKYYNETYKP